MTVSLLLLGWVETAVFTTSYLSRQAAVLRQIQAVAVCLWIICGFSIGAVPVVIANLIVAGAALYSSFRRPAQGEERPAHSIEPKEHSEMKSVV